MSKPSKDKLLTTLALSSLPLQQLSQIGAVRLWVVVNRKRRRKYGRIPMKIPSTATGDVYFFRRCRFVVPSWAPHLTHRAGVGEATLILLLDFIDVCDVKA